MKRVIVISTSLRRGSNSDMLADKFVEGQADGYNFIGKPNPVPENKQLLIIPGASHCDLYDGGQSDFIPWDKLEDFFKTNLQ